MPRIEYKRHTFTRPSLQLIARCNAIIAEYAEQGFTLTLRQTYYQLVARDQTPNTTRAYKRLSATLTDARNAGLVDWDAIEDHTRNLATLAHWSSPSQLLKSCAKQFRHDRWADQQHRPEVWTEKDALTNVFLPTCQELDVPFLASRGYPSVSTLRAAGVRLRDHLDHGQHPIILHFADHDPSGIDMTRDLRDRLSLYAEQPIEVIRLALTREQVDYYAPPPNPAKETDSRYTAYHESHGNQSWELDALEPAVITALIKSQISRYVDGITWEATAKRQRLAQRRLAKIARDYTD